MRTESIRPAARAEITTVRTGASGEPCVTATRTAGEAETAVKIIIPCVTSLLKTVRSHCGVPGLHVHPSVGRGLQSGADRWLHPLAMEARPVLTSNSAEGVSHPPTRAAQLKRWPKSCLTHSSGTLRTLGDGRICL